ncbi:orotate phosphoribosyltransferase [Membranihabitans marinus]|uniref:orotate phosphoribosyltransferase n=1 Tax=Membranihabitans marinus TaxID=1227546 RepID=UPI001F02030E|nr:orotate phosphoribosyltransferase [Membranihabitans marinus]
MNTKHKEIAEILLTLKAIKLNVENPFTWASGIQSPIYCDNRMTLSHPKERNIISQALVELCGEFSEFDVVAGVATAGIPYASILAHELSKPLIYVRSAAKGHGRQNLIEGDFKPGQRVLLIEDLISTGGSSIKAAQNIQAQGLEVVGIAAVFSYELEAGKENFKVANIEYKTLSNYPIMLEKALELNYISDKDLASLNEWNKSPQNWKK